MTSKHCNNIEYLRTFWGLIQICFSSNLALAALFFGDTITKFNTKFDKTKDNEYVLVKTTVWSCKVTSPLCRISCESHAVHKELVCQTTLLASNSRYKKPFSSTEITSFHSSSSHAEQLDWRSCARWTTQLSESNSERLATVQTYWKRLEVQRPRKEGHWPSKPWVGLFLLLSSLLFSNILCKFAKSV